LRVTLLFKKLAGRIDRLEEIGDALYLPDAIFYMGLAFSRKGQYEKESPFPEGKT